MVKFDRKKKIDDDVSKRQWSNKNPMERLEFIKVLARERALIISSAMEEAAFDANKKYMEKNHG